MNAIDMIPAAIMPEAAPLKGAGMSFCSSLSRIAENMRMTRVKPSPPPSP